MSLLNAEWAPNQADPEPTDEELINRAMTRGYTREVYAVVEFGSMLHLLVKPTADLDARFNGFCLDECEYLRVDGWACSIEDA